MTVLQMELLIACLGFSALGVWFATLDAGNLPQREKWPRSRVWGFCMGLPALIACIPHAAVVSPDFLLPFLWPLALLLPVLSFFYLDNFAARALGGLWILWAYDVVHAAWEFHWRGAVLYTVAAWVLGIAGIWISGKPCSLRDSFRLAARNRFGKGVFAGCCFLYALLALGMLL